VWGCRMRDRHHIALFLPDSKNPYMQISAAAAEAAAAQQGLSLEIHFAEGHFGVQVHQIYAATRAGPRPRILLVVPVQENALNVVSPQVTRRRVPDVG
jgi:ABC-type sugar transport system substrate-binding protein